MPRRTSISRRARRRYPWLRRPRDDPARSVAPAQNEEPLLGEQISEPAHRVERKRLAGAVERQAALDDDAGLAAQRHEILDRTEMDIRRVVPVVAEQRRLRHAPVEEQAQADAPMS